ncbi:HAD domain-containing protein [Hymenobacter sp. 102]|uniref:HAD domain-containing protein n=1 Tax=Hymenobacter sp. 102 TaxID=3403152 RepID=UPI003CEBF469
MKILLDIDGVLVTTPIWRKAEVLADGFLKFDENASRNLAAIISATNSSIVLTTTHRINFSLEQWYILFKTRGIIVSNIVKINKKESIDLLGNRSEEIKEWVDQFDAAEDYVIIDDDLSINGLPSYIKNRWVMTRPMIGLNDEATSKALSILLGQTK